MAINLFPDQKKIIHDIRESFSSGNNYVVAQGEVGFGKTYVSCEIIRLSLEKRKRVLFIAPRRQLIYQTVESLDDFDIQCGVIMAGITPFTSPRIQVASFDTITSRVSSGKMTLPEADLVIADEAHSLMSEKRIEILRKYPRVLGLTATPVLSNGRGMGELYQDIVQGPPMSDLVRIKRLLPMRYFSGESPDLSNAKYNKDGDYTEKFLEEVHDKPKLIGAVFDNWKRIASDRCTLVFAVNKKHAKHIYDEFTSHGVSTGYIDGQTETQDRERIKSDVMEGRTQVIINIGVMVMGVSWDRINCIVMARQTKSIGVWRQCLGRGSRIFQDQEDTIVIYHGNNFEELGMMEDHMEWSLGGGTVQERLKKSKEEKSEPKEIVCGDCGFIFKSSRKCPQCGNQAVLEGEAIPTHKQELKEVKKADKKTSPEHKKEFYGMLLGYCRTNRKPDSFALAIFHNKFDSWPYNKSSITPIEPNKEVKGYITYSQIAYAKRKGSPGR